MKKAQMGAIVILILVLIVALSLFGFGQKIFYKLFGEGTIETCRLSVLAQAKTELAGASVLTLECERRYIDIYPTKVQFGNDPDNVKTINVYENGVKKKSFKEINDNIVNYVVAEEMKTCWYEFGEAKTDIFPNNEEFFEGSSDDICFICSEIHFEDVKNPQFVGLLDYLKNTNMPEKKNTYWEYFNQPSLSDYNLEEYIFDKNKDTIDTLWDQKQFIFSPEETYAVIFYKDFDSGVINGDSGYHVLVLPTENLDKICETQAG